VRTSEFEPRSLYQENSANCGLVRVARLFLCSVGDEEEHEMATRAHLRPRIYLSTTLDEETAQALVKNADEAKLTLSEYTREVLKEHLAARRDTEAEVKHLREQSES
jgi:hypothetical protein